MKQVFVSTLPRFHYCAQDMPAEVQNRTCFFWFWFTGNQTWSLQVMGVGTPVEPGTHGSVDIRKHGSSQKLETYPWEWRENPCLRFQADPPIGRLYHLLCMSQRFEIMARLKFLTMSAKPIWYNVSPITWRERVWFPMNQPKTNSQHFSAGMSWAHQGKCGSVDTWKHGSCPKPDYWGKGQGGGSD